MRLWFSNEFWIVRQIGIRQFYYQVIFLTHYNTPPSLGWLFFSAASLWASINGFIANFSSLDNFKTMILTFRCPT